MSPSTMRSWQAFEQSMRNFEWLGKSAPGASDIDFVVERRNQFLLMEFKPMQTNGVSVGFGQHLLLVALAALEPVTLYLVGEVESTGTLYIANYENVQPAKNGTRPVFFGRKRFQRTTKEGLRVLVGEWFAEASQS